MTRSGKKLAYDFVLWCLVSLTVIAALASCRVSPEILKSPEDMSDHELLDYSSRLNEDLNGFFDLGDPPSVFDHWPKEPHRRRAHPRLAPLAEAKAVVSEEFDRRRREFWERDDWLRDLGAGLPLP